MEFNRSRVVIENKTNPKPIFILILIFISFFFFLFLMVFILSSFCSSIMSSYNGDSDNTRSCSFGKAVQYSIIANCEDDHQDQFMRLPRRGLGGPGSSPPRCASKCGKCTPCTAVHVPVPPGTPVTAEYYPEAWRCKCGNKLYMP